MLEDYQENDEKPLNCPIKRRKNTIRKTFTLPTDVVNELDLFRGSNTNGEKTYAKEFQPDLTV
jgi:hypothetical protein